MTYLELFELKALIDFCRIKNLNSSKRALFFQVMDCFDNLVNGFNKQVAKTYGGTVNSNSINFQNVIDEDAEKGTSKFKEIINKINEDQLQQIPTSELKKLTFNFLDSTELDEVISSVENPFTIRQERLLQKYLLK